MNPTRTLARKAHGTAVGLLALALLTAPARACPLCRDGATVDATPTAVPQTAGLDFSTSIYVMLGVVTGVGTVVGRVMYKAVRP